MKKFKILKSGGHNDYTVIFTAVLLIIFGLFILSSASSYLAAEDIGNSYYYLKHQILYGLSLGLMGFFLGAKIYYRYHEKLALPLLIIGVALLLLIFTPLGINIGGATRWIQIGPISFQPSEIIKLIFIIYLAAWLSHDDERQKNFAKGFVPFLIILGSILFLLIKQPATSTAIILATTSIAMYFASGTRLVYIISITALAVLVLGIAVYISPYRWDRVSAFLNPEKNLHTSGYQVNQAKIAIGSGGLWGVGYGQSTTKINYLPEPLHDSIFAVVAEEFGFIGSITLIGLLLMLVLRIFLIAKRVGDKFGQLLLVGFGSLIALQSFVNIGAISGLLPLTGTPLPFISYGGTALAIFMTIIGITNNISKYSNR
ncbi:MAG: putative lipid II flippase FtsW [Patescibacteria group bacterium]